MVSDLRAKIRSMEVGARHATNTRTATSCLELVAHPGPPQPCAPAELRALVHGGETDSDACETLLAQVARIEGALDLELADGMAALCIGDRLITLGFSNREVLDIEERTAPRDGAARARAPLASAPPGRGPLGRGAPAQRADRAARRGGRGRGGVGGAGSRRDV